MPAILCRLVKITAQKKLMVKLTYPTYTTLVSRVTALAHKKFPEYVEIPKFPTFILENDDGETSHFCMIALDKYDKQLLERKFEPHLRKDIAIEYRLADYDFTPADQDEPIRGINVQLTGIRKYNGKTPLFVDQARNASSEEDSDDSDSDSLNDPDCPNLMEITRQGLQRLLEVKPEAMDLYKKMASGPPLLAEQFKKGSDEEDVAAVVKELDELEKAPRRRRTAAKVAL